MKRVRLHHLFVALAIVISAWLAFPAATIRADSTYGSGTYGTCTYNSCGISLSSDGMVTLNVTPSVSVACTVQKDSVAVETDSSTGYTLTLSDSDTDNQMTGTNGGTISPADGTGSSPASLSANTWGFRVDGVGSFGAGPTSVSSSGAVPSEPFAAIPASSSQPETVATSSSAANPAVTTNVWYGICTDTSLPAGTFEDSVTYTAVVN